MKIYLRKYPPAVIVFINCFALLTKYECFIIQMMFVIVWIAWQRREKFSYLLAVGIANHQSSYSRRKLIDKIESRQNLNSLPIKVQWLFIFIFIQRLRFTYACNAIPKRLRMYFRYFAIREKAFTQRLDKCFCDSEPIIKYGFKRILGTRFIV